MHTGDNKALPRREGSVPAEWSGKKSWQKQGFRWTLDDGGSEKDSKNDST